MAVEVARRWKEAGQKDYGRFRSCVVFIQSPLSFKVSRSVFTPSGGRFSSGLAEVLPDRLCKYQGRIFWRIVRAAFQKRRKTILNALMELKLLGKAAGRSCWKSGNHAGTPGRNPFFS